MPRIPALDGLRAVAIIAVLIFHVDSHNGGFLGVDLFFVLSGFLITSLLVAEEARGPVSLTGFYTRRALRILPPLLAAMALAVALAPPGLPPLAPSLFFYANFMTGWNLFTLEHTWSLSVEEQFYLIWPLLFIGLGRRRVHALAVIVVVALAARTAMFLDGAPVYAILRWTWARVDIISSFLAGTYNWVSSNFRFRRIPKSVFLTLFKKRVIDESIFSGVGVDQSSGNHQLR